MTKGDKLTALFAAITANRPAQNSALINGYFEAAEALKYSALALQAQAQTILNDTSDEDNTTSQKVSIYS